MDTVIPRIVLASSSPRRKMLLEQLGIKFDVISSDIHENIEHSLLPEQFAETLALRKAQAVAASLSESIVIGADTIVVDSVGILGKPKDEVDAYRMLARLSGQVHRVITGLAIVSPQPPSKTLVRHETTKVKIATLSEQDIGWYIRTGEPMTKQAHMLFKEKEQCSSNGFTDVTITLLVFPCFFSSVCSGKSTINSMHICNSIVPIEPFSQTRHLRYIKEEI